MIYKHVRTCSLSYESYFVEPSRSRLITLTKSDMDINILSGKLFQNVISLPKQLQYFKEYKKRLESVVGRKRTEKHIKKSAFLISAATNDFVVNYFLVPTRRKSFSVFNYQQFLIQQLKNFIQVWFNAPIHIKFMWV